ncbi:hypothetical protein [Xanthomonas medicagonis]|uniref:hypothetical protein n=1 Tax=Xanthomonas medicagonis TaxID=3160841 RepID=UPI0035138300
MNIAFVNIRYFSVAVLWLCPLCALASVEADMACEQDFCWSVTKHRSEQLKDYYVYVQPHAIKQVVVRYQSGAQINVLIQEASVRDCDTSFIEAKAATPRLTSGKGCLVTKQGGKAVRFNYQISAVNVSRFLRAVDPVIWLSGYSQKGDFLPAASTLLALEEK